MDITHQQWNIEQALIKSYPHYDNELSYKVQESDENRSAKYSMKIITENGAAND